MIICALFCIAFLKYITSVPFNGTLVILYIIVSSQNFCLSILIAILNMLKLHPCWILSMTNIIKTLRYESEV